MDHVRGCLEHLRTSVVSGYHVPKPGVNDPCPCGSKKKAKKCCFDQSSRTFYKPPRPLSPPGPQTAYAHPKCYMRATSNCSTKISAEHIIPAGILRQCGRVGRIHGLPWCREGMVVGESALTAKCLCSRHNSAFSEIDNEFIRFFAITERIQFGTLDPEYILFNGDDIERFLLKMLCTHMFSKSYAYKTGERSTSLDPPHHWVEVLSGAPMPHRLGIYVCIPPLIGAPDSHENLAFQIQVDENDFPFGIRAVLNRMDFFLMMMERPVPGGTPTQMHRPNPIIVDSGQATSPMIHFSWAHTSPIVVSSRIEDA